MQCLRVRFPPWTPDENTSSRSSPECSPPCHGGGPPRGRCPGSNPIEDAFPRRGTQSGKAAKATNRRRAGRCPTFVVCGFESHPRHWLGPIWYCRTMTAITAIRHPRPKRNSRSLQRNVDHPRHVYRAERIPTPQRILNPQSQSGIDPPCLASTTSVTPNATNETTPMKTPHCCWRDFRGTLKTMTVATSIQRPASVRLNHSYQFMPKILLGTNISRNWRRLDHCFGAYSLRRPVKPLSENKWGGDERFNSFTTHST